jgi:glutamate/tyrosine decarboxylase-like PLP-dependent enzyme
VRADRCRRAAGLVAAHDAKRAALSQAGHLGVRKIAAQFGVDPSTVQRISRSPAMTV